MAAGSLVQLRLFRDNSAAPFGFRLQGGADLRLPLTVQRVFAGSPADGVLQRGDVILAVENYDVTQLAHFQVQQLMQSVGTHLLLTVRRGASMADYQQPSSFEYSQPHYAPAPIHQSQSYSHPNHQQPHQHYVHSLPYGPGNGHQGQPAPQHRATASLTVQNVNPSNRHRSASSTAAAPPAEQVPAYFGDAHQHPHPHPHQHHAGMSQSLYGHGSLNRAQKSLENLSARSVQDDQEPVDYSFNQLPVKDRLKAFNKLDQAAISVPRSTMGRSFNFANRTPSYLKPLGNSEMNFAWTPSNEKLRWAQSNPQNAFSASTAQSFQSKPNNEHRERPQPAEDHSGGPPAWRGTLRSSKKSDIGAIDVTLRAAQIEGGEQPKGNKPGVRDSLVYKLVMEEEAQKHRGANNHQDQVQAAESQPAEPAPAKEEGAMSEF